MRENKNAGECVLICLLILSSVTLWSPILLCPTTKGAPVPPTPSTAPPTRAATPSVMSGLATPSMWWQST